MKPGSRGRTGPPRHAAANLARQAFFCAAAAFFLLATEPGRLSAGEVRAVDFVNHGTAVDVGNQAGIALAAGPAGEPLILALLASFRDLSLLVVDALTGESRQLRTSRPGQPFGSMLSSRGVFYSYPGFLIAFDPGAADDGILETPGPGGSGMAWAEGPDGRIYAALYPTAALVSFDPESGLLTDHGPLGESELQQYPRALALDDAGWVYAGVSRYPAAIYAFHPGTGEKKTLVPPGEIASSAGMTLEPGDDGAVYGRAGTASPWLRFHAGRAKEHEDPWRRGGRGEIQVPYRRILRRFPNGDTLSEISFLDRFAVINSPGGEKRRVDFQYESGGQHIFPLVKGPDGLVYGNSGSPLVLFSFDPETGLFDRKVFYPVGHFNAAARLGDYLYFAFYSGGQLFRYDPSLPWHDENSFPAKTNPVLLASAGNDETMIRRPFMLPVDTARSRLVMGGFAEAGVSGGGLMFYDAESGDVTRFSVHDLLEGHTPHTGAFLPCGRLLVGTTTSTRGRATRKADEAEIFILDRETREIVHRCVPLPGADSILDLRVDPGGRLAFGIGDFRAGNRFFVFDLEKREVVHLEKLPYGRPGHRQGDHMMEFLPDGNLYILFARDIVQVDPETFEHRSIGRSPAPLYASGLVLLGDRLYFTSYTTLWSARLDGFEPLPGPAPEAALPGKDER